MWVCIIHSEIRYMNHTHTLICSHATMRWSSREGCGDHRIKWINQRKNEPNDSVIDNFTLYNKQCIRLCYVMLLLQFPLLSFFPLFLSPTVSVKQRELICNQAQTDLSYYLDDNEQITSPARVSVP